jgi:hypothetical protein
LGKEVREEIQVSDTKTIAETNMSRSVGSGNRSSRGGGAMPIMCPSCNCWTLLELKNCISCGLVLPDQFVADSLDGIERLGYFSAGAGTVALAGGVTLLSVVKAVTRSGRR